MAGRRKTQHIVNVIETGDIATAESSQ